MISAPTHTQLPFFAWDALLQSFDHVPLEALETKVSECVATYFSTASFKIENPEHFPSKLFSKIAMRGNTLETRRELEVIQRCLEHLITSSDIRLEQRIIDIKESSKPLICATILNSATDEELESLYTELKKTDWLEPKLSVEVLPLLTEKTAPKIQAILEKLETKDS